MRPWVWLLYPLVRFDQWMMQRGIKKWREETYGKGKR